MTLITVDQYGGIVQQGLHVKIYCDLMQDGIDKKKELESALKLQELINSDNFQYELKIFNDTNGRMITNELREIISKLQKTKEDEGKADE